MPDGNTTSSQSEGLSGNEEILADAREFLTLSIAADDTNRERGLDDLAFISGEQWDPRDRQQRALQGRPCLTINKLPTFIHQVTNDQRQNKASIKVHPVGEDDDEKAEIVQGVIRHIEYASNGTVATGTAVNSAATIGFGFWRLITRYCDETTFDQEIAFKRIRNAFTVYMDPGIQEPDGSDQRKCMISEKVPRSEFKKRYPKANASGSQGFPQGTGDDQYKDWFGTDYVRVSEFYRVEETDAKLVNTDQGAFFEDEMPEGAMVLVDRRTGKPQERMSAKRKVMWYLLTASEVLDKVEIPCRWIPVFPVFGDEVDLDGKVIRSGLVRHAKDPARMYNYWVTTATEEVALRPKTPYIGVSGQFAGFEADWANANTTAFPYLEYNMVSNEGTLAPAPSRQPMADMPVGAFNMLRLANEDIKGTTGLFDSSLGDRGNATSGIQERAQQLQGDTANFHYQDNLQITLRHCGRCIVDMMPKIYDGARVVQIMGEDEKISPKAINGYDEKAIDITTGKYDVTIGVGPAYATAKQEALATLTELGANWPELKQFAGDKIVQALDIHGADEIAERLKRAIPPNILGPDEQDQDAQMVQTPHGPVSAEQAGQMIGQLSQDSELLTAELERAQSGLAVAEANNAAKLQVAEANNAAKLQAEQIKADSKAHDVAMAYLGKMDVAELQAWAQLAIAQKAREAAEVQADAMAEGKAEEAP